MAQAQTVHSVNVLFQGAAQATLRQAVDGFLQVELVNKSEQTKRWYAARLWAMVDAIGGERPLGDVLEVDLIGYQVNLANREQLYGEHGTRKKIKGKKLSKFSLHGHVRAIRRFFKWLHVRGVLAADLASNLELPSLPKQGRKGISEINLRAIVEASKDNIRDHAIILFLESTAARRGGVAELRLDDLSLGEVDDRLRRRASVREKGEKERTVILSPAALGALDAWMAMRPHVDDDHVFLGKSVGEPWHALTPRGISEIIRRYKKKLGLTGPCSPHQFRHRWARHRLQMGMELGQVSQILGHADVKVTIDFYGQFGVDQLQDAYDKFLDD